MDRLAEIQTLLFALMVVNVINGQDNVTVSNTTPQPQTEKIPTGPGKEMCTNKTESGFGLWCYDCKENYAKVYDQANAVCLSNLGQVALRQCGPRDNYCKVERMSVNQQTITIERTCVEDCFYGCRYNGYGLTQERCTTCCRTPCCNTSDDATRHVISRSAIVHVIVVFIERLLSKA